MSMRKLTGKAAILAAAICVAAALPSWADTAVWKSNAGGDITEPTNWEGDAVPQAGDTLNFSAITSAQTLTGRFEDDRVFAWATFGDGVATLSGSLHLTTLTNASNLAISSTGALTIDTVLALVQPDLGTYYLLDSNEGEVSVNGNVYFRKSQSNSNRAAIMYCYQYRNVTANSKPVIAAGMVHAHDYATRLYTYLNNQSAKGEWVVGANGLTLPGGCTYDTIAFMVNGSAAIHSSANWSLGTSARNSSTHDIYVSGSGVLEIDTSDWRGEDAGHTITFNGRIDALTVGNDPAVIVSGDGTLILNTRVSNGSNKSSRIYNAVAVTNEATLQIDDDAAYIISNIVVSSGATLHIPSTTVNSTETTVIESVELADGAILSLPSASASALTARTLPITLPSDGVAQLRIDGPALGKGTYAVLTTVPSGYGQHLSVVGTALGNRRARLADDGESLQLILEPKGLMLIFK